MRFSAIADDMSMSKLLSQERGYSLVEVLLYAALVYVVLVAVRMAAFFFEPYLQPLFDRILGQHYPRTSRKEAIN